MPSRDPAVLFSARYCERNAKGLMKVFNQLGHEILAGGLFQIMASRDSVSGLVSGESEAGR